MPIGRGGGIDGWEEEGGSGLVSPDGLAGVPLETEAPAGVELPAPDVSEGWVFSG